MQGMDRAQTVMSIQILHIGGTSYRTAPLSHFSGVKCQAGYEDGDNLFPECHGQVALPSFFRLALKVAQRRRCAAAIFFLAATLIFLRFRTGLAPPYTPANAVSAAFNPDNCFATRSRSLRNCFTNEDKFGIGPRDGIVAEPPNKRRDNIPRETAFRGANTCQ